MIKEIKVNEETHFVITQNPSGFAPIYLTIYTGESITKVHLTNESIKTLISELKDIVQIKL